MHLTFRNWKKVKYKCILNGNINVLGSSPMKALNPLLTMRALAVQGRCPQRKVVPEIFFSNNPIGLHRMHKMMELMLCLVRKKYMRRYCRSQEESYLILFLEMF